MLKFNAKKIKIDTFYKLFIMILSIISYKMTNKYNKLENIDCNIDTNDSNDTNNTTNTNDTNNKAKKSIDMFTIYVLICATIISAPILIIMYNQDNKEYCLMNVISNHTLPNGVVFHNEPCRFKYIDDYINCELVYNINENSTTILFNKKYISFMNYGFNGYLIINYNNKNYNQLLNGFDKFNIYIEKYGYYRNPFYERWNK